MGPPVFVADDVRVAKYAFTESVGPLECQLYGHRPLLDFFLARDENRFRVKRFPPGVDLLDELGNPAGIVVFNGVGFITSFVRNDDFQACVQKRSFLQSAVDLVKVKFKDVGEDGGVWFERDDGARVFASAD